MSWKPVTRRNGRRQRRQGRAHLFTVRQVNHLFRKALFGKEEVGITVNASLRHAGLC